MARVLRKRIAAKHVPIVGRIQTTNVFGEERLDTAAESEVCIPSLELSSL